MSRWTTLWAMYRQPKMLTILLLGFSSGVPFLLTLSTLSIWLKEAGVSNTTIGCFVLFTIPYTFKFLWAPLVDRLPIPWLTKRLGRRRSWALVSQVAVMLSLVGLGQTSPHVDILWTGIMTLCVAMSSATQDIVLEAYRIERIEHHEYGPASSATFVGFRLGMMASGAGALYLASFACWSDVYNVMAMCVLVGMITILLSQEPSFQAKPFKKRNRTTVKKWSYDAIVVPLKDLLNHHNWVMVVLFIVFYKMGDTAVNVMNTPFLIDMGYSKIDIANIAKLFGISAMIMGGILGGLFLQQLGLLGALVCYGGLQIIACLVFSIQARTGYDLDVLTIAIGIENITCGFGATAFIAYLSALCRQPFTATHFALLSSLASLARVVISLMAGYLADQVEWATFFLIVAAMGLVFMGVLLKYSRQFQVLLHDDVSATNETSHALMRTS